MLEVCEISPFLHSQSSNKSKATLFSSTEWFRAEWKVLSYGDFESAKLMHSIYLYTFYECQKHLFSVSMLLKLQRKCGSLRGLAYGQGWNKNPKRN